MVHNLPVNTGGVRDGFCPLVSKSPWSRKWQHTPVFLTGKFHGQRNLAGYSPWCYKRAEHTPCDRHSIGQFTYIIS